MSDIVKVGKIESAMMEGTAMEQNSILHEIQTLGYNVVECNSCGISLLVRDSNTVDIYKCFICDAEFDSYDCSDLVFPDKNGCFANG